jgi:large subunit ribosomal protein L15
MNLSTLKPAKGSISKNKRLGRGQGSGGGGTAGRGHKGAKSRSGYKVKFGFEGGQMPLQRRIPKFGFKNPNRVAYTAVNVGRLQELAEKTGKDSFSFSDLISLGLAGKNDRIKILGTGELKAKVEVEAHAFSKTALKAIEDAGGKANTL